ncbi:LPS export ABC transporter periplasmic protein LptC [Cohaesibacter celericrescens]|uniref:LPS export ABC transporter periplasmic protein LptC n=1 Tax=Cohaesibacter celericrescens TaxID=2067669 RepID=A0A2N5XN00_9HYPH|nr:LPS export ABC transporter periplasmic protein LptC [Cohaesibacter celericrescens]PLW75873.1 LPS export ABC transporter periplasmic protein LptC [Cohaesibacter celericrescens]
MINDALIARLADPYGNLGQRLQSRRITGAQRAHEKGVRQDMKDQTGSDQMDQRAPDAQRPLTSSRDHSPVSLQSDNLGPDRKSQTNNMFHTRVDHDTRIISAQEQQTAFRSAQRHTKRVKVLKWGLPLIALSIIAGFVGWVAQQKPVEQPVETVQEQAALQQDELIMQNPNLNGFSDGRAYEVIADRAVQKIATPDVINLETLTARITDEKGQWVTITSQSGLFNQTSEQMTLNGTVDVKSSLGYDLTTDIVNVDMKKRYLETETPVEILSKDILLKADKLEAINNGEQFRFIGNVHLRIDAAMMNKSDTKPPAQEADQ